jgi:hypothetical protein
LQELWLHGRAEHGDVSDVDVCNERLCNRSIWCAGVTIKPAKGLDVEYCCFCVGIPRSLASKGSRPVEITVFLNTAITKKIERYFKR